MQPNPRPGLNLNLSKVYLGLSIYATRSWAWIKPVLTWVWIELWVTQTPLIHIIVRSLQNQQSNLLPSYQQKKIE